MPLRPEDLDFMQSYLNGAPREELRGKLDSMYGPVTPEMRAGAFGGPDARTAENMSTDPGMSVDAGAGPTVAAYEAAARAASPAPPPVATDAGGMSVPPPMASEAPAMSTVSPAELASMGAEAQARLATPGTQEPGTEAGAPAAPQQTPVDIAYQRYLLGGGRGGGRVVPGGEDLDTRTISRELHGKLSPETADELDYYQRGAEGLAVEGAEQSAQGLEAIAAKQREQAQHARSELASYNKQVASKQAEYDIRQAELDDMRADVEKNPVTYFSGKDTFTKVLNVIGLAIMGLDKNGAANSILPLIENEVARKQKERGTAMSLVQDRLNRFKEGIPSPEAQAAFQRSLGLDAVAAETEAMTSRAKAEDVRQRGFAIAAELRQKALEQRAAGEAGLIGKEEIKTKNMPAKVVGGGKSREELIIERGKKAGDKNAKDSLYQAIYGQAPPSAAGPQTGEEITKAKHERELFVRLPDGSGAYATTGAQKKELQDTFNTSNELLSAYAHLKQIHKQVGPSAQWNREALGDAEATVARIQELLREKGVKLNESTMKILEPLSGAKIKDWVIGPGLDAAIDRATQIREAQTQQAREQLSASPWEDRPITKPVGGSGSTFKAEE